MRNTYPGKLGGGVEWSQTLLVSWLVLGWLFVDRNACSYQGDPLLHHFQVPMNSPSLHLLGQGRATVPRLSPAPALYLVVVPQLPSNPLKFVPLSITISNYSNKKVSPVCRKPWHAFKYIYFPLALCQRKPTVLAIWEEGKEETKAQSWGQRWNFQSLAINEAECSQRTLLGKSWAYVKAYIKVVQNTLESKPDSNHKSEVASVSDFWHPMDCRKGNGK